MFFLLLQFFILSWITEPLFWKALNLGLKIVSLPYQISEIADMQCMEKIRPVQSIIETYLTKTIDCKIFIGDKPGRMNTKF